MAGVPPGTGFVLSNSVTRNGMPALSVNAPRATDFSLSSMGAHRDPGRVAGLCGPPMGGFVDRRVSATVIGKRDVWNGLMIMSGD
ncbi:MAG: hypothetical protein F4X97_04265 [Boseongicola sp. SB0662_bin_57]|nr:hypothetical protein [Boseongicola sp. SB0662_bin_57]